MAEVWEGWFTVGIVFVAFGCLLWDVIQPDHVMIGAVAVLMAAGVVSVEEGLAGFANEGLLTVAVLFVVAAGISATGGLDWYMSKLLGHPTTIAGAQLRLMIPIAVVSAFLNNTPVVAVMIPIVQRWAENIHIPKEQVMIPLSFASILGGTCTLIGTSTNLVVLGMLKDWKGSDGSSETKQSMGLFDLGLFGVPVAMTGLTYMLIASRALLPGGKKKGEAGAGGGGGGAGGGGGKSEDLIVGARLQAWSAAVGKTVAGSGLRGLPGLYLVSVKREDTLIRAVGPEFVLSQGDVLYFTGMVESIGNVCAEYGLLAVTTEHDSDSEGGSDEDGSDGDENDGSPPAGRVSPEDTGRGGAEGAEGAEGADESAVAPMELGSTTETESDGSATKVQTTKARAANVGIPPSVPETSALMEIQMLARSQAIGGVAGEWQSAGQQGGKSSKSQASGGKPKGRALSSGGETSATSAGSASESEGGGGWSSGGELGLGRRSAGDGGETSEGNAASGPDGASSDAATGLRRRRRRGSSNVRSGQSPVGPDGWPDDDEVRDMASGVALDPGERRSLRMYQSSHSRGHRGRRSVDGRSARHGRRRRDSESAAVSRAAAEKALGPPKVTVELDPEDPTAGRMVLGISAPDRPGLLHDISQGLNRLQVQLLHCEASVVAGRSVSIWRLQVIKKETTREEISTVIDALLAPATGADAAKKKGVSVLRARVRFRSALVGKTAGEANFQTAFGAAIIGMLRGGRRPPGKLGQVRFAADDILVLQCEESSPLLAPPPEDLQSAVDALARVPSQGSFLTLRDVPQTPHSDDANPNGANANGILKSPGSSRFFRKKSAGGGMEEMDAATRTTTEAEPRDSQTQTHGGAEHKAEAGVSSGEVAVAIPETHEASDAAGASSDDFAGRVRAAHVALEVTGAKEESREFLIAVRIKAGAREFIKKTAEDAGLRSLPGLFLVSVERPRKASGVSGGGGANAKESSSPRAQTTPATVAPPAEMVSSVALVVNAEDEKGSKVDSEGVDVVDPAVDPLQADDVLWYAGTAASIAMIRKIPGLAPYATDQVDKLNANSQERRLIQAVVAKTGPLVGKSIRDIKFRSRYNAVVLAVHREGVRVHARIGDVVLHPGDVLLLDAGPDFHREAGHSGSGFALVSVLEDSAPPRLRLLVPVLVIAVAMIVFYTAGVTELIIAAIFAAGIMIACGALSEQEARDAIKWDVIVTIAAAFGMSKALQNSGVAGFVAEKLVRLAELSGTGRGGLLVAVYLATFVISNVVTNNAAAALMFPVAAEAAERQGESLASMSFLVMLAASASFMSPFGYQTNLMVYGPGGYVFKDFLRFGVPMQVVQMVVSVVVIVLGDRFWYVSWGATGLGFAATCVLMTTTPENALNDFIGFFRRLLGKTTAGADEDEDEDEGRRRRSRRAR